MQLGKGNKSCLWFSLLLFNVILQKLELEVDILVRIKRRLIFSLNQHEQDSNV